MRVTALFSATGHYPENCRQLNEFFCRGSLEEQDECAAAKL
jgi:hypothetical protein